MKTGNEILNFLSKNKKELTERFSVRQIGLFGSFLFDTATANSDVDILVDLASPTFDHYMDLKFFLEDHFERKVDLVLADTIKPRLKPIINQEVRYT